MNKRQSKEEKIDRIVDRLQCLHYQLSLSTFRRKQPFERTFALKDFRGLLQFDRQSSNLTLGITLLTVLGSPVHKFELSITEKFYDDGNSIDICAFTSLPYKRGQACEDLKVSFTTQIPFEIYIRQMVLTSCKRGSLLTSLVACLERASNLMELEKQSLD